MTALLWSLSIWSLVAVAWALIWGSIGWTRGERAGLDPAKAAALCWLIGPFALPVINRWRRAQLGSVAMAERLVHGTHHTVAAAGRRRPRRPTPTPTPTLRTTRSAGVGAGRSPRPLPPGPRIRHPWIGQLGVGLDHLGIPDPSGSLRCRRPRRRAG